MPLKTASRPTSRRTSLARGRRQLLSSLAWSFEWSLVLGTPFLVVLLITEVVLEGRVTLRPLALTGVVLLAVNGLLGIDLLHDRWERRRRLRRRRNS